MSKELDPISFSLAFVHAMRKRGDLTHVPSVRTSVALPRFLSARWFRTGSLSPKDYVEAAVYLTPLEDQAAAFDVARAIVFPKDSTQPAPSKKATTEALGAPVVAQQSMSASNDDGPSILADLAGMELDLNSLDLGALDAMLDQKVADATELKSLDLVAQLSTSADIADNNLAKLATAFGGAAELEAEGVRDKPAMKRVLLERIFAKLGELSPEVVVQAARAGFADDIADDVTAPWEKAALFAANDDGRVEDVLEGVLGTGDPREIGRTLRYFRAAAPPAKVEPFRARALSSARHLADWAQIVEGLGTFVEPPDDLVASSARDNLPRTLVAANALEVAFAERRAAAQREEAGLDDADLDDNADDAGDVSDEAEEEALDFDDANAREPPPVHRDLRHTAFGAWAASLTEVPSLDFLLEVFVPADHWYKLASLAFDEVMAELDRARALDADARMEKILTAVPLARRLRETKADKARELAAKLATRVLVVVLDRARFLPLLDALADAKLLPDDGQAVVKAGVALGIEEDEILARLSQPLEQLRFLIEGNIQDLKRHMDLVDQIDAIPDELLDHLVACCIRDKNLMGLATLLAIALGPTLSRALAAEGGGDLVDAGLQWKGIGGGENLLLQWYHWRDALPESFKQRIKLLAKQALLDAALPWMQKGVGGAERGLMPQARTRPYRAGDELDNLDVEGTLERMATSGKTLDQLGSDDLVVTDTASGRAGFGVLIDISGSMTGKDLAVCAIAVVMLLGKLKPEEIALALFESNTHVVKTFADNRDLDEVANEMLELRATGGTRVDAALRFMASEFAARVDVERRVLFLLSDFAFFESAADLRPLLEQLSALDVRFLGAAHGHFDKNVASLFVDVVGGQVSRLASIAKLPDVLLAALSWIGDGAS